MQLYALLTRTSALPLRLLTLFAVGSSVFTVSIMMLVNRAAQTIESDGLDKVDWSKAGLFCAAIALYFLCEMRLLRAFTALVERAIHETRARMIASVGQLTPPNRESMGDAELFDGITQATASISQNSQYIAIAFRSALLIIALMGYIFYVSKVAFVMLLVTVALAGWAYVKRGQQVMALHGQVAQDEQDMFEGITDHLDGWKEVRMLRARKRGLTKVFDQAVAVALNGRIAVQSKGFELYIFGQLALYFLLGVVVFAVPSYTDMSAEQLAKTSTAVLFVIGPIGLVIQAVAILGSAEASAGRVIALEARLDAMVAGSAEFGPINAGQFAGFESITLRDAEYVYPDTGDVPPFHLGPVSVEVKRGEIMFISGGNGSGKSTLMRMLTGLHMPVAGSLNVDGRQIGQANLPSYRALFSSVLMNFHLFERLYGLRDVPGERISELLDLFEIGHIVRLDGDRFRSIDLSTGQRKRLALIVALLEDRPILVLDEWAADQDPQFRKKFYHELLPMLRDEGKTVIAVTHDDAYFSVADRRLHLSEGMQFEEGSTAA